MTSYISTCSDGMAVVYILCRCWMFSNSVPDCVLQIAKSPTAYLFIFSFYSISFCVHGLLSLMLVCFQIKLLNCGRSARGTKDLRDIIWKMKTEGSETQPPSPHYGSVPASASVPNLHQSWKWECYTINNQKNKTKSILLAKIYQKWHYNFTLHFILGLVSFHYNMQVTWVNWSQCAYIHYIWLFIQRTGQVFTWRTFQEDKCSFFNRTESASFTLACADCFAARARLSLLKQNNDLWLPRFNHSIILWHHMWCDLI